MSLTVFEIRNYLLQPNMTEHFIDYFEANFISTLEAENMHVLGQFRLIGEPDHYVWIRAYENMDTRRDSLFAFYDGPVWKQHRTTTNSMMIDSDNVHLLRPLDSDLDLTCGQTSKTIAASLADASISLNTGLIAVDFYPAYPDQREELIDAFQTELMPIYLSEDIDVRGCFVAEMSLNTFPRHPAFQNEHEYVVITAYPNEEQGRAIRSQLAPTVDQILGSYLSAQPETLLLRPTLRSPLRYFPR
ncbi:MAG: hypothetical protein GC179_30825 [Anaerolineaceae bacterium]|nr:hypothetical protein [Anaerolineaceae bacterium]